MRRLSTTLTALKASVAERPVRTVAALVATFILAGCSTQPETLPNPYVSLSRAPVRTLGIAAGSSPFAASIAAALSQRGFAVREVPQGLALSGPYLDYAALRTLQAEGVDGVLTVSASRGGTGPLDGEEGMAFLDRAAAANATVTATADGAVLASADWRPRLGWHFGPTPTRSASGPILGSEILAPPAHQLADVLTAQIAR
jgi:hypothetical protein